MTELTRLFDMIRDKEMAAVWLHVEREGWEAKVSFQENGWRVFFAECEPTPEAAVADVALQLAEYEADRQKAVVHLPKEKLKRLAETHPPAPEWYGDDEDID